MPVTVRLILCLVLLLRRRLTEALSYNQPTFCSNASWDPNGINFANASAEPFGLFVDTKNFVYATEQSGSRSQVWSANSNYPIYTIPTAINDAGGIFVSTDGDIYVGEGYGFVSQYSSNGTFISMMNFSITAQCLGVFIDISNNLYCSLDTSHQVSRMSLNSSKKTPMVIAGNGTAGTAADLLYNPNGIFVHTDYSVYVADYGNARIQKFLLGQSNGTTVAGNSGTISLSGPIGVVLDGNSYLFIVDTGHQRIVGSGPDGFRCIVGCSGVIGSNSTQFYGPRTLGFDSYGNIFVTDRENSRVQKFLLMTNSCDTATTIQQIETSTKILDTSTQQITNVPSSVSATTAKLITTNQTCYPPGITIIPSTSSLSSPLQTRGNQDLYISSNIALNCINSLAINTQWTINNCTPTCSSAVQVSSTINTVHTDLYIPARSLPYGIYELQLTVTMVSSPNMSSSNSAYVKITASNLTANLVQFGTSMITRGHTQNLTLDPGRFSIDPDDDDVFNADDWEYEYYCRIYEQSYFPNVNGSLLTIDDPRTDPANPSCLSNHSGNETSWQFAGVSASPKSSLIILSGSLLSNRTYQFMVNMANRYSASLQATGYLSVHVVDTSPPMIVISCIISPMCVPNVEYQLINPTTQVALFSVCLEDCTSLQNITWNIYFVSQNSSSNTTMWTQYNQMNLYEDIWFFGTTTSNFTAVNTLFFSNPQIIYWRFEVVYTFLSKTSSSVLNFLVNQPPQNGSCTIYPHRGTTSTLFTISCPNWFDEDGIEDYSVYSYTTNSSNQLMTAFSAVSLFTVRLSAGNLSLIVDIRDTRDCITKYDIGSVNVLQDTQNSTNHSLLQFLGTGNPNLICQIVSSLSQEFNQINTEYLQNATDNGVPATSISISPLGSSNPTQKISNILNTSALIEYNQQMNSYADLREYLLTFATKPEITNLNSIKLQSSALSQLTQTTNQLTRTASLLASTKCYQLSLALQSMAKQSAYEDVQTAAMFLVQCSSNALNAINGPLQERTTVLDLDFSRANLVSAYYDTDIESDWSNLNLFANGNDFSSETIEIGRNLYYQKQLADQINAQSKATVSLLTSALNIHLNIGQRCTINTSAVFMLLATTSMASLANTSLELIENATITLPFNLINSTSTVSIRSLLQPLALADQARPQSNTNLSRSISFSILDSDGNELPFQTNINQPITLIIPRDPNFIFPSMTLQNVTSMNENSTGYLLFNLHYVNLLQNLPVSLHFEMHPLNTSLGYLLIYKFDSSPQLNSSLQQIDGWTLFCPVNITNASLYTYFLNNQLTVGHQSVIFGLREFNSSERDTFCSNQSIVSPPISNQPFHFSANYELRTYISGCYYLDGNNRWQADGLLVGPLTNHDHTQCYSTHLTTFSSGFLVLPAPVNWNYVFTHADFLRNNTIYITVICVCILYILLLIYARLKDKKDIEKLEVTLLPDNHQRNEYSYQILVHTGHRKDAGTQSKVQFIVVGDDEETHVRTFINPNRKILQRNGIDAFLMTIPKSLGPLNYIRIWHDNTGQGSSASWFLKYIVIHDLQTMEKSYFICQKWFAVEKGDGKIERIIPVADDYQRHQFTYLLSKRAYHNMSDGHLWFSIFSRPPSSRFTCVQRCTCCFVLLFLSMLLNILYYDQEEQAKIEKKNSTTSLSFGPFYISSEQIAIGVMVELISFLPSLLLIQLFRRIRSRQKTSIHDRTRWRRKNFTFPWWCVYLAYSLSLIIVIVAMFFIIARGIEFGDLKAQKWLTSLVTSFLSSVLLIQPTKGLSLAIFFAFFLRNSDDDVMYPTELHSKDLHHLQTPINRLDQIELHRARQSRLRDIHMWQVIREVASYVGFLATLFVVTYSYPRSNAAQEVNHLRKFFCYEDFNQIATINDYWHWLEMDLVSHLRARVWYNGQSPRYLNGYIDDKTHRLIGWANMRQLRVPISSIHRRNLVWNFTNDYSFFNEEKHSFAPGWTNDTRINYTSVIEQAFQYRTSEQLDTYIITGEHATYNSGGYVYDFRGQLTDLRSNLSQLHRLGWIDTQTRAVIIQMSLYNPNVQLFTSVTLLVEFLSTSSLSRQCHFQPVSFPIFISISQLICSVFYLLFVVDMIFIQIQRFSRLKQKYFYEFWSWIDLGIIGCSWTVVAMALWKYNESTRLEHRFRETNGYVYINLQKLVDIDQYLTFFLGFCCFFSTLKCLRLCRFIPRLEFFLQTIRYARPALLSFVGIFSIIFIAFTMLFYLLFISTLSSCSNFFQTMEMMSIKFHLRDLIDAAPFLGPFTYSLFIFVIVFVSLRMVITIINESLRTVRKHEEWYGNDDQRIWKFMLYRFRLWIGRNERGTLFWWYSSVDKQIEFEEPNSVPYHSALDQFPQKVEQLLNAFDKLCDTSLMK